MRLLLLSFFSGALTMFAMPLTVSTSGVYGSTIPASSLTTPGAAWSLSFTVDSAPSVSNVSLGNGFDVPYSDFDYRLNGSAVTLPVADIRFFNAILNNGGGGMFSVCFENACPGNGVPATALVFEGPQAYNGSESSPAILSGNYTPTLTGVRDGSLREVLPNGVVQIAGASVATPEPANLFLVACGFFFILGASAFKRRDQFLAKVKPYARYFSLTVLGVSLYGQAVSDPVAALKGKYQLAQVSSDHALITPGTGFIVQATGLRTAPAGSLAPIDNKIDNGQIQGSGRPSKPALQGHDLVLQPGDAVYVTSIDSIAGADSDILRLHILTKDAHPSSNSRQAQPYEATFSFSLPAQSLARMSSSVAISLLGTVLNPSPASPAIATATPSAAMETPPTAVQHPAKRRFSVMDSLRAASEYSVQASMANDRAIMKPPQSFESYVQDHPTTQGMYVGMPVSGLTSLAGQPQSIDDLGGGKQIYHYKQNMTVTVVTGKVTEFKGPGY